MVPGVEHQIDVVGVVGQMRVARAGRKAAAGDAGELRAAETAGGIEDGVGLARGSCRAEQPR